MQTGRRAAFLLHVKVPHELDEELSNEFDLPNLVYVSLHLFLLIHFLDLLEIVQLLEHILKLS